jgi:hypothetical protein
MSRQCEPILVGKQRADGNRKKEPCRPDNGDSERKLYGLIHQVYPLPLECDDSGSVDCSTLPKPDTTLQSLKCADVAQLVEQLIRNQQVIGSSPIVGSIHCARFSSTNLESCSCHLLIFHFAPGGSLKRIPFQYRAAGSLGPHACFDALWGEPIFGEALSC